MSDRLRPRLARTDADHLLEIGDEDLAVADLARASGVHDRFDHLLDARVVDGDLDLHLRQEIDDVFGAAIELRVAALAAEALHLGHRDALRTDFRERLAYVFQLERLDDCSDELHRPTVQLLLMPATYLTSPASSRCVRRRRQSRPSHLATIPANSSLVRSP